MSIKQWHSNIPISTNYSDHLKWWDESFYDRGQQIDIQYCLDYSIDSMRFQASLLYAKGVDEHEDRSLDTPYSALLILYNESFLLWQEGLSDILQRPGTIVLLDVYENHELAQIDEKCDKWAAICIDYYEQLVPEVIEAQLHKTYSRIFD